MISILKNSQNFSGCNIQYAEEVSAVFYPYAALFLFHDG
jgi:hypothetical protein